MANENQGVPQSSYPVVSPAGLATQPWYRFFVNLFNRINTGASGTITLAKITGGGSNGSITVVNGLITSFTEPT